MRTQHQRKVKSEKNGWKMMGRLFSLLSFFFLFSFLGYAASYQDYLKSIGKQKIRKVHSKHTAVAAVRGVDEPQDVDKTARNYEALQKMEKKSISQEKLLRFIKEGKLVLVGQDGRVKEE